MNFQASALWQLSPAPAPLWWLLGGGLAALSLATAIVRLHPALKQQTKVRQAVESWFPVVAVAAFATLLGSGLTWLVFGGLSAVLLREGLGLLPLTAEQRRAHGVIAIALAVAAHALVAMGLAAVAVATGLVYVLLVLAPLHMLRWGPEQFIARVGGLTLVLLACVISLLFVGMALVQAPAQRPFGGQGQGCFLFVLVIVSDAMQFVGGKRWGRRALVPTISPGKTWEGLGFALLVCTGLGAWLGPWLLALPAWQSAGLAAAMVWLGLTGDLLVSCWKRDAGVKDTGAVLPGQGGVLDRCDSLLFVAPWFWAAMQLL